MVKNCNEIICFKQSKAYYKALEEKDIALANLLYKNWTILEPTGTYLDWGKIVY